MASRTRSCRCRTAKRLHPVSPARSSSPYLASVTNCLPRRCRRLWTRSLALRTVSDPPSCVFHADRVKTRLASEIWSKDAVVWPAAVFERGPTAFKLPIWHLPPLPTASFHTVCMEYARLLGCWLTLRSGKPASQPDRVHVTRWSIDAYPAPRSDQYLRPCLRQPFNDTRAISTRNSVKDFHHVFQHSL